MNTPKPRRKAGLFTAMSVKKSELELKAMAFIKQKAFRYYNLDFSSLPTDGGIYLLSAKQEQGKEWSLYINFTNDIRSEIITMKIVHERIINGSLVHFKEGYIPKIVSAQETLQYIKECFLLRYLVVPDLKERMGIMVIATTLLKPLYIYN